MAKSTNKLKAFTSIAPANLERQKEAISTWGDYDVYSFNTAKEIEVLKKEFTNVTFIENNRTAEHYFGKPYPLISAFIDHFKTLSDDAYILINSDIEVCANIDFKLLDASAVFHRYNYDEKDESVYLYGLDMFYLLSKDLEVFSQSLLCIGQCFWDYMVPYRLIENNRKCYRVTTKSIRHKSHKENYTSEQWERTARFFRAEINKENDYKQLSQFNNFVYNCIINNTKEI